MRVASSAIRDIAYDPARQRLRVTFTSGHRYVYKDVPGAVHRAFMDADSKGRFFHAQILDRYAFDRLH